MDLKEFYKHSKVIFNGRPEEIKEIERVLNKDIDEVEKICTHVCILKKGSEVIQGKIDDLVKGENFIEVSSEN